MKKIYTILPIGLLLTVGLLALVVTIGCKSMPPTDGEIVIYPTSELKHDTITIDSTYSVVSAIVTLQGHTTDSLFLWFSDESGSFWKETFVGDINATCSNDWYNETLPVSYYTKSTNDGDSVVIKYSFGVL